jgi:GDP-L-fucose synthase
VNPVVADDETRLAARSNTLTQGRIMEKQARIFVAGDDTVAGAAILERLHGEGYCNLLGRSPAGPDLTDASDVNTFFAEALPEYVFLAAGRSGGIHLNRICPADLMLDNLRVITNVVPAAHRYGTTKLLYLASSCAYPRIAPQPLAVDSLMTGVLEPTSEAYATAKLAGWQLCNAFRRQYGADFITAFTANAFGPHDDYGPDSGHVIPSLIRRAHEAKMVDESVLTVWGTGKPRREFMYARDLADACVFVMRHYDGAAPINLGIGSDLSIGETARAVARAVGYRGEIRYDPTKPDGAPLKRLNSSPLMALGWRPTINFHDALVETYHWFLENELKGLNRPANAAL